MISLIVGLLLSVAVSALMGYLATVYIFLQPWAIPFYVISALLALAVLVMVIFKLIGYIQQSGVKINRRNKTEKK